LDQAYDKQFESILGPIERSFRRVQGIRERDAARLRQVDVAVGALLLGLFLGLGLVVRRNQRRLAGLNRGNQLVLDSAADAILGLAPSGWPNYIEKGALAPSGSAGVAAALSSSRTSSAG
jgi:hypothetical protein